MRHAARILLLASQLASAGCRSVTDTGTPGAAASTLVAVEENGASVVLLDARTGAAGARFAVDARPHEVEVSGDGRTAYVSNFGLRDYDSRLGVPGRSVAVLDLVGGAVRGRLWLAGDSARAAAAGALRAPHGVKLRPPNGRELFVNAEAGDSMVVFDAATGARLRAFPVPAGTHNFIFSARGDTLWLMAGANGVYRLDPADGRVTGHLATATPARGLAWTPDGRRLLVSGRNELLFVDPGPVTVARRYADLGVGQILYSAFTPDGARVLAPTPRDSQVVVVDVASGAVLARLRAGASPIRVVVAPDGARAFVANAEDDHVSVIDLATLAVAPFGAAVGPNGLALAAVPRR